MNPLQLPWLQNLPMTAPNVGRAVGWSTAEARRRLEDVEAWPVPSASWRMYRPADVVAAHPELAAAVGVSPSVLADDAHHDIAALWLDRARHALAMYVIEQDQQLATAWFMGHEQVGCHLAGKGLGLASTSVSGRLERAGGLATPARPYEYVRAIFGDDVAESWNLHRRYTYLTIASLWDERAASLRPSEAHA